MSQFDVTRMNPIAMQRRLLEGLEQAQYLLETDNAEEALDLLKLLDKQYPRNFDVMDKMAITYLELEEFTNLLDVLYRLHHLIPNRPDVKFELAGAYLINGRMGLALQTFRQFLERWPNHEHASEVKQVIGMLETQLETIVAQFGLSLEPGLIFTCKHEEVQVMMNMGKYQRAKQLANELLAQPPIYLPVLNNLAQIYWMEGNLPAAIETAKQVLEIEPDNVHALANLTRYYLMLGETDHARIYAQQLKDSPADAADGWSKKIETLAFLGDNEGVLAVMEQAKQAQADQDLPGTVWHWCAVAEYQLDNIRKAQKAWQRCQKEYPDFQLPANNLAELRKPEYERVCPQAFTLQEWMTPAAIQKLAAIIGQFPKNSDDPNRTKKILDFLDANLYLCHLFPLILTKGEITTRTVALQLASLSQHPLLLDHLKTFCLGKEGSDDLRMEAFHILSESGLLTTGESYPLWIKGESHRVIAQGFFITSEPPEGKKALPPAAARLMEQAIEALQEKDGVAAEDYLRRALKLYDQDPVMYNNLAAALQQQGKREEANVLLDQIIEQFPDYFFGKIALARRALEGMETEKARTIVDQLMQKKEMHYTEFGALCALQIDVLLDEKNIESALSWLDIWQQGYSDDPKLPYFEDLLSTFGETTAKKPYGRKKRD